MTNEVSAVVQAVKPSPESAMYVTVIAEFTNQASAPVTVLSYEMTWPAGRFVASGVGLRLAPGESASRTVRVTYASGSLDLLTVKDARIAILEAK